LHIRVDVPPYPPMLEALAEGLVLLNVEMMRFAAEHDTPIPSLFGSGIVYRREPEGREWWESAADMLTVVTDRSGDCEDIAAYRAAELRFLYGEDARVAIVPTHKRGGFHCLVEREDGTCEDPSLELLEIESEATGVPVQSLAELRTQDTRYAA
jgi:hypothetical protein